MTEILTPEQVAEYRSWANMHPVVTTARLHEAIHQLGAGYEALREQLAEAKAAVRALATAAKEHDGSTGVHPWCRYCQAMAHPGVKRLMEEGI